MATAEARGARLGRLERSALTGVLVREAVNYSSYWKSSTFSSTVEPTIYLLAGSGTHIPEGIPSPASEPGPAGRRAAHPRSQAERGHEQGRA